MKVVLSIIVCLLSACSASTTKPDKAQLMVANLNVQLMKCVKENYGSQRALVISATDESLLQSPELNTELKQKDSDKLCAEYYSVP